MSRAQTVVGALFLLSILLGFVCVLVARSERNLPALRRWGWASFVFAAGLFAGILTGMVTNKAPLAFVSNVSITCAGFLAAQASLSYSETQLPKEMVYSLFFGSIGVLALNAIAWNSSLVWLNVPTVVWVVLLTFSSVILLKAPIADAEDASRMLVVIMLITAFVLALRFMYFASLIDSSDRSSVDLAVTLFAIFQIIATVASTIAMLWVEVRRVKSQLIRMAYADVLTELPNRRATMLRFEEERQRAVSTGQPLCMLMIDLDHFKRFNDNFGHSVGDMVLQHVANVLNAGKRREDFLGRIGGEEFIVLLPNLSLESATVAASRISNSLTRSPFVHQGREHYVTFSGGIAVVNVDGVNWDSVFSVADSRTYASKVAGRNRVTSTSTNLHAPVLS